MTLAAVCFAFVGGIALSLLGQWPTSSIVSITSVMAMGATIPASGFTLRALRVRHTRSTGIHSPTTGPTIGTHRHVTYYLATLGWMIAAACVGAWRSAESLPTATPGGVAVLASNTKGTSVTLTGTIATDPIVKDSGTLLRVSVNAWTDGRTHLSRTTSGIIEVSSRSTTLSYSFADQVTMAGTVYPLDTITDAGYRAYLRSQGVAAIMNWPQIQAAGGASNPGILGLLLQIRHSLANSLSQALPQPLASLVAAILLGGHASSLPQWLVNMLIATGLIHIIAVSGLKIALLAGSVHRAAIRLIGRRDALYPALAVTWMYVAITGASPAAQRSGIMWSLALIAARVGRSADMTTGLALAATVILAFQPALLLDTGFQMSLLGVAGIAVGTNWIAGYLRWVPIIMRESFAVTLAAQVATLPIVANAFSGRIALISPLANAVALPLLPPIMLLGIVVATSGIFSMTIATSLGLILVPPTELLIGIATLCDRIPFASMTVPTFSTRAVMSYYGALGGGVLAVRRHRQASSHLSRRAMPRSPVAAGLGVGVASVMIGSLVLVGIEVPDQNYHITIINVGHSQSIVLQTPRGNTVVIDGGDQPHNFDAALDQTLPYWRRSIDLVVVTNPDSLHVSGLLGITAAHHIALAADSGSIFPSVAYANWRATLWASHVSYHQVAAGTRWILGPQATLDVLAPAPSLLRRSGNVTARMHLPVALRVRIGRFSMLVLNSYALQLAPRTWNTIGERPMSGDSAIVLPQFPQRDNAAGVLLRVHGSQMVILPSQNDSAAVAKHAGPLFMPPGVISWTAAMDGRFVVTTNGQGYQSRVTP